jgi:hypothetical protein
MRVNITYARVCSELIADLFFLLILGGGGNYYPHYPPHGSAPGLIAGHLVAGPLVFFLFSIFGKKNLQFFFQFHFSV